MADDPINGGMGSSSSIWDSFAGVGLGIGAAGAVGSMLSGMQASNDEKNAYGNEMNIAGLDMQVNQQRRQMMVLANQRQQIENLRNVQKTRSVGMAAGVNAGAQFGSGLAGAQSAESSKGAYNALGFSQSLEIGKNIFGLEDQISKQKIAYAQNESAANSAKGMSSMFSGASSMGLDLLKAAPMLAML